MRLGTGANCSSIGSMVDTLFLTSVAGAALTAAVLAGFRRSDKEPTEPTPGPISDEDEPDGKGDSQDKGESP